MATMKVTFGVSTGRRGWREEYYLDDAAADPADNRGAAEELAKGRTYLFPWTQGSGHLPYVKTITVVDVNIKRKTATYSYGPFYFQSLSSMTNTSEMSGTRAGLIKMITANGTVERNMLIKGLPLAQTNMSLNQIRTGFTNAKLTQQLKFFTTALIGRWSLRSEFWPAPLNPAVARITGVAVLLETGNYVLTVPGNNLTPLQRIKIVGLTGLGFKRQLNGKAIVLNVEGELVEINRKPCQDCSEALTRLGLVHLPGIPPIVYPLIERINFMGWTSVQIYSDPTMSSSRGKVCCR